VSYFANSQLKQLTLSNSKLVTYTQDNNRLLPKGMTVSGVANLSYSYDNVGNISGITDSVNPTYNRSFGYDGLNRLTSANGVWGAGSIGYDTANNVSSKTLGTNSLTYNYDAQKKLSSITGSTPYTFTYDVYGNVTSNGRDTFTYDDASQLKTINQTTPTSFMYDGNGHRVTSFKGMDIRYFVYSQSGSLMYEKNISTGDEVTYFYLQGSLLAQSAVTGGVTQTSYYHNDLLGSPIAATSQGGTLLWREEYDPYGNKLLKQNTTNRLWYTGHAHDEDSGLTYMGARYYDPIVGRFMGIDPVGFKETNPISFNRYAYANNNPYKFVDPDGRDVMVISGGLRDDSVNVAGHVASAVQGNGMSSYGNGTPLHASVADYIQSQSAVRAQQVTIISTTAKQDEDARNAAEKLPRKVGLIDNCAARTNQILNAAGVDTSATTYKIPQNGTIPKELSKALPKFEAPHKKETSK
jgi:RHS repeat-associated protein